MATTASGIPLSAAERQRRLELHRDLLNAKYRMDLIGLGMRSSGLPPYLLSRALRILRACSSPATGISGRIGKTRNGGQW